MSSREKAEKKLLRREKAYETERLMREKRSEEYKVIEEVFDRATLKAIYNLMNKGLIEEIHGVVSAGKEARIYWGKNKEGKEIAIKIYLTTSAEFKKGMLPYIEGDPRFSHVRRDTRSLIYAWAQKEFKNLLRAQGAGVRVPEPVVVEKNVLIMEFIGKDGVRAPLLKETTLRDPERVFRLLLTYLRRLYYKGGMVHADLSEYNIMVWRAKPVIFDVGQSVLIEHPMANTFLRRDIENLYNYFKRLNVDTLSIEKIYGRVTGGRY